jgi:hypothetical protein
VTGGAQDLGRRDVFSRMPHTEVLLSPILSPTPPCFRSPSRPCCSCRACWPPNDADEEREAGGEHWAVTGRRYWYCAGLSMALGWSSWPSTTGSAPRRRTGICTRVSTPSPRRRPLTDDQRTINVLHAGTRALAERGNSLLEDDVQGAAPGQPLPLTHRRHHRCRPRPAAPPARPHHMISKEGRPLLGMAQCAKP